MGEPRNRTAALTDVNVHLLRYVRDAADGRQEWEFFCECGQADCDERVFLSLDDFVQLREHGEAVVAEGHHLSQVERARRLQADTEALRAQAQHQAKRATKNLSESFDALTSDAARQLTDGQLEAELTIAVAHPGLAERYEALLAEREHRRQG